MRTTTGRNAVRPPRTLGILKPLAAACLFAMTLGASPMAGAVLAPNVADTFYIPAQGLAQPNNAQLPFLKIAPGRVALVRFDLSTLPLNTQAGDVERATVIFSVQKAVRHGGIQAHVVLNPSRWNETSGVTYLTAGGPFSTHLCKADEGHEHFISIDVTEAVRYWLTYPEANHGVAFVPAADFPETDVEVDSREMEGMTPILDVQLYPGPQGLMGPSGPQGPQGPLGPQGPKGDVGAAGPAGVAGPVGPAGAVGAKGDTGPKGETGAIGPAGQTGATGPAGPAGPQGVQGLKGDTGAMGPAGPQGLKGDTGAMGPIGPVGMTGATGPAGPAGPAGPQGVQGLKGETGAMGPAGPQGPQGDAGLQGPIGLTGPAGPAGPAGLTGPTGLTGPAGATGPVGATGPAGPKGDTGSPGPAGATGATGPQGPAGPMGPMGPMGPSGVGNLYVAAHQYVDWVPGSGWVECNTADGWFAIGGGAYLEDNSQPKNLHTSAPFFGTPGGKPTGWIAGYGSKATYTVYAICVK